MTMPLGDRLERGAFYCLLGSAFAAGFSLPAGRALAAFSLVLLTAHLVKARRAASGNAQRERSVQAESGSGSLSESGSKGSGMGFGHENQALYTVGIDPDTDSDPDPELVTPKLAAEADGRREQTDRPPQPGGDA